EDHKDPIGELRRLVRLRRAYNLEDAGDNFIAAHEPEKALDAYAQAAKLAPEIVELQFWAAVSMYTNGQEAQALKTFHDVFAREGQRWVDLVPRLSKVGLFPDDPAKIAQVQKEWTGYRPPR